MQAHGVFTVKPLGQIVFVDAEGPWNQESAKAYRQALFDAIESMAGCPWALLVVLHGQSMMTPEAEQEMVALVKARKEKGMRSVALVCGDTLGRSMIERQFSRIYQAADVQYTFVDDIDDAYAWLGQQGYQKAS